MAKNIHDMTMPEAASILLLLGKAFVPEDTDESEVEPKNAAAWWACNMGAESLLTWNKLNTEAKKNETDISTET